jgi:hypothetical protein
MPARPTAQLGFDETLLDNPELEAALEARLKRKHSRDELQRELKEAHDAVIGLIELHKIVMPEEGAIRVGRFRLTRAVSAARSVSFETEEKSRIKIEADDDGQG